MDDTATPSPTFQITDDPSASETTPDPSLGIWSIYYYKDEFNQPTTKQHISTASYFTGTFSNSATTDSSLSVNVAVDSDGIFFTLFEYSRGNPVKNSSTRNDVTYNILMRTEDDSRYTIAGTMNAGSERVRIDDRYKSVVITALSGEGSISFHLVQEDRPTTTYLFSVRASNFAYVYKSLGL